MSELWQLPPALACPHCDLPLFYDDEQISAIFHAHFYGNNPSCPACGQELNWWATVLHTINGKSRHTDPLMAVGAHQTAFMIALRPNQPQLVRFTDYKIPADAQILRVSYHQAYPDAAGGLTPIEMHGSTPHRYTIPSEITLYPASAEGVNSRETSVNIATLWVPHTADNEAWRQLVNAFDAYGRHSYIECIVPANVAVESTISPLLNSYLERVASKDNVKRFLEDGATYSHQLNIVLPALLSFTEAPKLADNIRGLLNRLRDYRNDIAHRGSVRRPLDKDGAAECLCAALFGFQYLRLVRPILLSEEGAT